MDVGVGFHGVYDRSTLHATETILFGDWVYWTSCASVESEQNPSLVAASQCMHIRSIDQV